MVVTETHHLSGAKIAIAVLRKIENLISMKKIENPRPLESSHRRLVFLSPVVRPVAHFHPPRSVMFCFGSRGRGRALARNAKEIFDFRFEIEKIMWCVSVTTLGRYARRLRTCLLRGSGTVGNQSPSAVGSARFHTSSLCRPHLPVRRLQLQA